MPSNLIIITFLLATFSISSYAQSSSSCTTALVSLSPCLNYISGNDTAPSGSCCNQLTSVVQSEPQCLCSVLNGGASSIDVTVNQTRALAMPGACKVTTPSASKCNGGNGSRTTPSPTTSTGAAGSTSGASKDVPTTFVNSATFFQQINFYFSILLLIMATFIMNA